MKNFRNRLIPLEVEEIKETEEDIQINKIKSESKKINLQGYYEKTIKFFELEKQKIIELENLPLNEILCYMENKNPTYDLSFEWLNQIQNLNILAKCICVNSIEVIEKILLRDLNSEFKLIKLMTEDSLHRDNFIKLERNLFRSNRYKDILPYKHNITLIDEECTTLESINQTDSYINASYIDGPTSEDKKFFIATQGPLGNTVGNFWKLIFTKNIKLIVMLCDLREDSRIKCERYWPVIRTISTFENIDVYTDKEEIIINKCLIKRDLIIRCNGIEKKTTQLHMINWPDHSIPDNEFGYFVLEFILNAITEFKINFPASPILVHCSAGTGRTGGLIAVHNVIRSLFLIKLINRNNKIKIKPFFSVFNVVRKLREQRIGMVSSHTQYKFIYEFCLEWIKRNFEL